MEKEQLIEKASKVKILLTDCDGVLTDGCVYYTSNGEEMKKFSLRDGMGTERLKKIVNVDTGIVTGENARIIKQRAKKLKIKELHTEVKDKVKCVREICDKYSLSLSEIAYIGDDTNDIEVMKIVGISACPNDAFQKVKEISNFTAKSNGGNGAYREFAELIIEAKIIMKGK